MCVLFTQLCLFFCNPMDCRTLQAIILEWVAISFSRGSFWYRDQTLVFLISSSFFTFWATREVCLSKRSLFIFQLLVFCIYGLSFRYLIFWWDLECVLGKLWCILNLKQNNGWSKLLKEIFHIIKKILSVIVIDRQQSSGSLEGRQGSVEGL